MNPQDKAKELFDKYNSYYSVSSSLSMSSREIKRLSIIFCNDINESNLLAWNGKTPYNKTSLFKYWNDVKKEIISKTIIIHEAKELTKQDVVKGRSNAYKYLKI